MPRRNPLAPARDVKILQSSIQRRGSIEQGSACSRDYHGRYGGKMGQEYALTQRKTINQVHSVQPQPVTKFISYKLEGIGSTGKPAFITPRSAVRSRPPLPATSTNSRVTRRKKSARWAMRGKMGLGNIQLSPDLTEITCHSSSVTDNKIII
jgi:hypothetical protein